MKTQKTLENVYLYRMTHVDNIPHILEFGITGINSKNSNPAYKSIGDTALIGYRSGKSIETVDGRSVVLGDFIPFYFGVRMPMLYVIQHGGNFVPRASKASEIVYVVVRLVSILQSNPDSFFTDGHAIDSMTHAYDCSHVEKLTEIIDWDAVAAEWWSGENVDTDIKRRKQAEYLVLNDIEPSKIAGFVCSCAETYEKLVSFGADRTKIKINPKAYY